MLRTFDIALLGGADAPGTQRLIERSTPAFNASEGLLLYIPILPFCLNSNTQNKYRKSDDVCHQNGSSFLLVTDI